MITVYKKVNPKDENFVNTNDVFFNKKTSTMLDENARDVIWQIDNSELLDKFFISSRFDGTRLNVDKLSTGCKTALNILYNPDMIFDISECGENALEVIYAFDYGKVYCDYPMIAFNMETVQAADDKGVHVFNDYDDLREWWRQ